MIKVGNRIINTNFIREVYFDDNFKRTSDFGDLETYIVIKMDTNEEIKVYIEVSFEKCLLFGSKCKQDSCENCKIKTEINQVLAFKSRPIIKNKIEKIFSSLVADGFCSLNDFGLYCDIVGLDEFERVILSDFRER